MTLSIIEIFEPIKNKQEIILQSLLNEFDINHVRKSNSIVLSGGERRRLEIARTLASKPNYLLLDEPLTGLDQDSRKYFINLLKLWKREEKTIVMSSHDINFLKKYTNYSLRLDKGEINRSD